MHTFTDEDGQQHRLLPAANSVAVISAPLAARNRLQAMIAAMQRSDLRLNGRDAFRLVLATPEGREQYALMTSRDPAVRNSGELAIDVEAAMEAILAGDPFETDPATTEGVQPMNTETITIGSSDVEAIANAPTAEAKQAAAAALIEKVRKIASGQFVAISKRAGDVDIPTELADVVATAAQYGGTLRDAANRLMEAGGNRVQKSAATTITKSQAIAAYGKTADGQRLYAAYSCADGHLTASEYVAVLKERAGRRQIGGDDGTWGGVVDHLAKNYASAMNIDYRAALDVVQKRAPEVIEAYQREQRGL